jgi:hypothetical protein
MASVGGSVLTGARKLMLAAALGAGLWAGLGVGPVHAAPVVANVPPPKAIEEKQTARPSPRHVWLAGYYRWDGKAYVWKGGHWEVPPRAGAVWVPPRWMHRAEGYVFTEGRWR